MENIEFIINFNSKTILALTTPTYNAIIFSIS